MTFALARPSHQSSAAGCNRGSAGARCSSSLTLLTGALWLISWRWLPETLPPEKRTSLRPGYLARTYAKVMRTPAFLLTTGALAFNAPASSSTCCQRRPSS